MAEAMEFGGLENTILCIVREKDWLKSWMKSAVATGGSKEHSPAGEEEQDATSTISAIQREFLRPISPVAVPLPSPHTSETSTDGTIDGLIAFVTAKLCGPPLASTTLCQLSRACTPVVCHPKALPVVEALLTAPMGPTLSKMQSYALSECFLKAVTHNVMSDSNPLCLSYEAKARLWAMYLPAFRQQVSCIVDGVKSGGVSAIPNFEAQLKSSEVIRACHDHLHLKYFLDYALKSLSAAGVSPEVVSKARASVQQLLQMQTRM